MRRLAITLISVFLLALALAPVAQGAFGLKDLDFAFSADEDGTTQSQAGAHPFALEIDLAANTKPEPELPSLGEVPDGEVRNLKISQIPGLVANPTAAPPCTTLEFLDITGGEPACSPSARLGTIEATISGPGEVFNAIIYNLTPPPGIVERVGFIITEIPVIIDVKLSDSFPYNPIVDIKNISDLLPFYDSHTTIWGVPAAHSHDKEVGGEEAGISPVPFLTTPRACVGPLPTTFQALSWQGDFFQETILTHDEGGEPRGFTECAKLGFSPTISARPTSQATSSPSGLDLSLDISDEGLTNPNAEATGADLKKVVVTLPEGITANPSLAEGLEVCREDQMAKETAFSAPGEGCPEASKIGSLEVESPLLEGELLKGSLFIAKPYENPFGTLLALYMTVKDPKLGIGVRVAGKVEPDPKTGQLIATFGDPSSTDPAFAELPQLPFSHFRTHFREGGRSPLISPPACGSYEVKAELTPSSGAPPVIKTATFTVNSGPNEGPCPPSAAPFDPGFQAGTANNAARHFSPFSMRLTRRDGDQDLTKLSATLAPGLAGSLAGISKCPDAQIALAKAKTGLQEKASPSCPQSSLIGHTSAGAGVGSQLTYVGGRLYLAGPFHGAPFSVVSITPAVAGPFDVGTVVVRFALQIDPKTAVATIDGAASDPIPHILAGIPLAIRDVRAYADRPNFTFNPTNCDPFAIKAQIWGGGADLFSAADDSPVSRSARFQAADCASLGFKPRFDLRLKGGTKRGDHPSLKAIVTPRPQDANFKAAVVTLPRSAFLDQGHIRTICTRVQFAAAAGNGAGCPQAAIYGFAKAWTPILDEPVQGPVYLRSSNHNLPDLVFALKGPPQAPVNVEISARIDSHKGGIRTSFEGIPDLPVSRFVLEMQGGKKGLIVNSRGLCAHRSRTTTKLTGQNNARYNFNPPLRATGCAKK